MISSIARVLTGEDVPCDCWSEEITDWYGRDGDTDWLFEIKAEVPLGRELAKAFALRCVEELKPQRISVNGRMHTVYSWHEVTMLMHGYRAMAPVRSKAAPAGGIGFHLNNPRGPRRTVGLFQHAIDRSILNAQALAWLFALEGGTSEELRAAVGAAE